MFFIKQRHHCDACYQQKSEQLFCVSLQKKNFDENINQRRPGEQRPGQPVAYTVPARSKRAVITTRRRRLLLSGLLCFKMWRCSREFVPSQECRDVQGIEVHDLAAGQVVRRSYGTSHSSGRHWAAIDANGPRKAAPISHSRGNSDVMTISHHSS